MCDVCTHASALFNKPLTVNYYSMGVVSCTELVLVFLKLILKRLATAY